jgi:hypothetical protein
MLLVLLRAIKPMSDIGLSTAKSVLFSQCQAVYDYWETKETIETNKTGQTRAGHGSSDKVPA